MKKILLLIPLVMFFSASRTIGQIGQPSIADSTGLNAFMDGVINSYLEEEHIAGASLVIIQNGDPLLINGYGYSDIAQQTPVVPQSTMFRIGSISKLFVWTAVMQQVERGVLDLNANINQYIDAFQIPETYPEPVSLRHLMTHTAGFEDHVIGLFALDSSRVRPLEEILFEELPARVRPPGQFASYSNHGTALAAYIVEEVTNLSFQEYVDVNILEPLGMSSTTFRQPPPPFMQSRLSNSYAYEQGTFVEKPFEYIPLAPIGGATATAADMIPFMQAHLNLGTYNSEAILDSATAQLMQSPAFQHTQEVNPMRYGFIDLSQNGVEIIGHGGDTSWFHSKMALFPEYNLGFFLTFNSQNGAAAKDQILERFVDRYFPSETSIANEMQFDNEYLQRFSGNYRVNRYPHKRLTKIIALFNPLSITVTEEGQLKTFDGEEGEFWVPVDSRTFQQVNGDEIISFQENSEGEITHLFIGNFPIIAFEKVPFISSRSLHFTLLFISIIAFSLTTIYWPGIYLVRRNYRPSLGVNPPLPVTIKAIAWINSLLMVLFLLGMMISLGGPESIVYGISTPVQILFVLPFLSSILTLLMGYYTFRVWDELMSGFWSRLTYSVLTLIFIASLWQLYYWNFLGF